MNKKAIFALAVLLALALAGCSNIGVSGSSGSSARSVMTGYVTFSPKDEATLADAGSAVNAGYVIVKAAEDFDTAAFSRLGAETVSSFAFNGAKYYRLYKKGGSVKLIADLEKLSGIAYAEHELISSIPEGVSSEEDSVAQASASRNAVTIASVLNDPETWGRFGHFETTGAIAAYKAYGVGPNTVYVMDIDTGINMSHEDFHDASGASIVEYAKSAFAEDGSYVGDQTPFLTVPAESDWDDEAHGSHTAGTIAAVGNNGKGVAGVCWKNVKLISYKCFSNSSSSSGSDWAVYGGFPDIITWKQNNNITQTIPVNMSLGGSFAGQFELEMLNYAMENGLVIIASMGNDGQDKAQYPAAYSGVIAVGATRANNTKVHFSNLGNYISVSAPGYNIYSTNNVGTNGYVDMSGTSMAAPFVTGTVAYLLSFNPTLKLDQIKTILESTADDIGDSGWDEATGYGQVNVKKAVDLVKSGSIPSSGSVYSNKKVTISVQNNNSNYSSGITLYPKAVVGQPVYLYDSNGTYVCLGLTNGTNGSVDFNLLKPGTYTAVTNYFGEKKTESVTVDNSADKTVSFSFDTPILLIQTVINTGVTGGDTSGADSVVSIFDSDGKTVAGPYDKGTLDSLTVSGLTSGKTYYVEVSPYNTSTLGEYGLNVGFAGKTSVSTTNGRGTGADDTFEPNNSIEDAKPITVGTDYALYLGDDDFFSFVMP